MGLEDSFDGLIDPARSRVLTVADAGHMVNEEAPDIVNRALIEFLRAERTAREDVESGATMA